MRPLEFRSLLHVGAARRALRRVRQVLRRAGSTVEVVRHVVGGVAGCALVVLGLLQAPPAWRAAHADGVPGTLRITAVDCTGKGPCSRSGDFLGEDGDVVLLDVGLVGAGGDVGDTVAAFYEGDPTQVYGSGWGGTLEAGLMTGGGAAVVGLASLPVVEAVWLRRRPPTGRHARPA
ncbi:hypothetical protein [Phycicoccus sp.]|uniref:hypothetical protein n=1 Tax=Phycicoccus sp. TaxID=1902410 RepID=UPI002C3E63ED|nr:hypothetical protein [Phycicoccus sp.]HMM93534.1 hypothetical protein [Phycicoccus sp.]